MFSNFNKEFTNADDVLTFVQIGFEFVRLLFQFDELARDHYRAARLFLFTRGRGIATARLRTGLLLCLFVWLTGKPRSGAQTYTTDKEKSETRKRRD